jgi:hypothetical protein
VEQDGPIVSVVGARDEAVTTDAEWSASWIAALSPAVAPHLEAWLRMAAEDYERRAPLPKVDDPNPRSLPVDLTGAFGPTYWSLALDLAKSICPELVEEDQK